MRPALAVVATCLTLAANTVWAVAQPAQGVPASTVEPQAQTPDAGMARHTAEVRHLQRAVSAQEAKRQAAQRRLQQQDREIQSLRRQLQTTNGHDSVRPY